MRVEPRRSTSQRWLVGPIALAAGLLLSLQALGVAGQSPDAALPRGGTLRVVVPELPFLIDFARPDVLDPNGPWLRAFQRCCLSRSLLSHNGQRTDEGGAVVHPDLAESLPTISPDGLTWTFRLKPGLRYGPPFEDVAIVADDFVRGFHRALGPGVVGSEITSNVFRAIEGASAYASGHAASISGLEAPDDRTLVIRLTEPSGALEARLAMPVIVPIPQNPDDPDAPFGIAQGHDDGIGPFLVSTGPYMLEGADALDFSVPAGEQKPIGSLVGARSATLVRNPSWDPASDALRPAYPDRIEISYGHDRNEALDAVLAGRADLFWNPGFPPTVPPDRIADFRPEQIHVDDVGTMLSVGINVAVPPFDDVHVRRAVAHAIDKARLVDLHGGAYAAAPVGHLAPDSLLDGLLQGWDPYGRPDGHADIEAAKAEMARSTYDSDGDGVCDAEVCASVRALGRDRFPGVADAVRDDLAGIGIDLAPEILPTDEVFRLFYDPRNRVPMFIGQGYVQNELNGSSWFADGFSSTSIGGDDGTVVGSDEGLGDNASLLGATPEQLSAWGYEVTVVPDVDARVELCLALTGAAQFECWAGLDQYLMLEVVPWVPYAMPRSVTATSSRVASFAWDQLSHAPAFDRIALTP